MNAVRRPAFLQDLTRCALYIGRDSPQAADRLISATEQTCLLLAGEPGLGHSEKFRKLLGIRSFRVSGFGNYLIIYRVTQDSIEFLRLIHGARDLPRSFKSDRKA